MVREGYKQTELGEIPEDWVFVNLPEKVWFQEGPGLRNWQFTKSGMKVINVTNLEGGVLNLDRTDRHISINEFNKTYSHFAIDSGDIVMASSGNSYCKVAVVRECDLPLLMNTSVIRFKPLDGYDYQFLKSYLKSTFFVDQIDLMITGGAQPNFGPYHLRKIKLPCPCFPEQQAIGEALSAVDGLIDGLEKLIAKKRDIKTATMQQLLTGKTRLPGFNGEWSVAKMSEVTSIPIQNGVFNEPSRKGRGCKLINVINLYSSIPINTQSLEFFDADRNEIKRFNVAHGDIFFTRSSLTADGIAHCNIYEEHESENILFDCHIIRVRPNVNLVNPFFLFRYCTASKARQYLVANAKTTTMTTIDQSVIANLTILLPPPSEQAAIAEVLTHIDHELNILHSRLSKTRAIKQGMMQELLTGKTRII